MWDVEPESNPNIAHGAELIVEHVAQQVRLGSIILLSVMYPGCGASLTAVEGIILRLNQDGRGFATVSQLPMASGSAAPLRGPEALLPTLRVRSHMDTGDFGRKCALCTRTARLLIDYRAKPLPMHGSTVKRRHHRILQAGPPTEAAVCNDRRIWWSPPELAEREAGYHEVNSLQGKE